MDKYEQYSHHNELVWVRKDLKGRHREHCLCFSCLKFKPEPSEGNCPIANTLFENCLRYNVVTPVFECPVFDLRDVNSV